MAEGSGLPNRRRVTPAKGANPSLSANVYFCPKRQNVERRFATRSAIFARCGKGFQTGRKGALAQEWGRTSRFEKIMQTVKYRKTTWTKIVRVVGTRIANATKGIEYYRTVFDQTDENAKRPFPTEIETVKNERETTKADDPGMASVADVPAPCTDSPDSAMLMPSTVQQSNSPTVQQSNSPTVQQSNSPTVQQST